MGMKKWVYIVLLLVLFCGCKNKKTAENENGLEPEGDMSVIENTVPEKLYIAASLPVNGKVYVASVNGFNLRSNYGITGEKIKLLPQNAELTVLERSETAETFGEMYGYWYKVDTGKETGWIFGGSVSLNPVETNGEIQIPIEITGRENHDWLTEYDWYIEDGRDTVDPKADHIYWHAYRIPIGSFKKFDIPPESTLYQNRLRTEMFNYEYQTEEKDKLFPLGSIYSAGHFEQYGTDVFELQFGNNYSFISTRIGDTPYGRRYRVGEQGDFEHPLVGIWGELPFLEEYRLVDPADCVYYLTIDKEIPGWAVRYGTYLLKRVGDRVFETITSFPDGHLRFEILHERLILLTPLFSLSEEEKGRIDPLAMRR